MPVKREKLEQLINQLLAKTKDPASTLTIRTVKRTIEDELGLDEGDLDSQTNVVKEILTTALQALQENDGEEEGGEGEESEKAEKAEKTSTKRKSEVAEAKEDETGHEEEEKPKTKRTKQSENKKTSTKPQEQENEDGDIYYELDELKRITIKNWQGKNHVDLRNFYKKDDGTVAPTPKGVMLTKDQWNELKANIDKIDKLVSK